MIDGALPLIGLITLCVFAAFWLDRSVPALSRVGASLLALVLGAVLSNTNLVPVSSPVYDGITGVVTSLAIAWLLLSVNLADLKRAGPRILGAFSLALLGTAIGAAVGAFLFGSRFGDDTWRLAGTLTGTYSGGSVNFVAVGRAVELPDALFAGANAADALTTGLWLAVTLTLPLWLKRWYPPAPAPVASSGSADPLPPADADLGESHPFFRTVPLSTLDLATLLALGFGLVLVAEWLGTVIPAVPSVLWLTTLALVVGHVGPWRDATGAFQLGNLALHFFFVVIGIFSKVSEIMAVGVAVFYFTVTVVLVHGLVVFGLGRAFRLDVGTLAVASQAAVGGPSSALAVAVSRKWTWLVLPGVVVGLLGYAVGNYLGLAVAAVVRGVG